MTEAYASSFLLSGRAEVLDWPEAITDWLPYIDMVGVDFFESQGNTDPDCYERLYERIATAVDRAEGKPVAVTSIGVPSGPNLLGWSEENQATYIGQAFDAAMHAHAVGFFLFEIQTPNHHGVEISDFDVEVMDRARRVYNGAWCKPTWQFGLSALGLGGWLVGQFRAQGEPELVRAAMEYCTDHFFRVLETAEKYWGFVRSDESYKPAFEVLRERYEAVGR